MGARQFHKLEVGGSSPSSATIVRRTLSAKLIEILKYRVEDPRYAEHVKYLWLTTDDGSDVKVYEQKRPVEYADYKPGMLYVSVYEVFPLN